MPSRKVEAATVGKRASRSAQPKGRTTVRFGAAPADVTQAREQEDRRADSDQALKNTPWKHGTLVELEFTAGSLTHVVEHKLGGKAKGAFPVSLSALVPLTVITHEEPTTNPDSLYARADTHIKINATSACKATVWIWR